MSGYSLTVVLVLGLATGTLAQIIPKRPFGYVYNEGSNDAPVLMDVHMGPLCPDSAAALPNVKMVADHYGQQTLRLTLHMFPLPYHHQAYLTAIGAQAVRQLDTPARVYQWFQTVYANLDSLSNTAVANMTQTQIIDMLAIHAGEIGVDMSKFRQMITSPELESDVRAAWKYSCSRSIFGTPTFLLNDVKVEGSPAWTVQDWKQVIDPLLTSTGRSENTACPSNTKECKYLPGKVECCTKSEYCIPNVGCSCLGDDCLANHISACPSNTKECKYLPGKVECCTKSEYCIPNVGCSCLGDDCLTNHISTCTDGTTLCEFASGHSECCTKKQVCLPKKGCASMSELFKKMIEVKSEA